MIVLVDAIMKICVYYFGLDNYEIPNDIKNRSIFLSILTLGIYPRSWGKQGEAPYPLIEAYFLEHFDKLVIVLAKGWKLTCHAEIDY